MVASAYTCECGGRGEVKNSRRSHGAVTRRRYCARCDKRWTTLEMRDDTRMSKGDLRIEIFKEVVAFINYRISAVRNGTYVPPRVKEDDDASGD